MGGQAGNMIFQLVDNSPSERLPPSPIGSVGLAHESQIRLPRKSLTGNPLLPVPPYGSHTSYRLLTAPTVGYAPHLVAMTSAFP